MTNSAPIQLSIGRPSGRVGRPRYQDTAAGELL